MSAKTGKLYLHGETVRDCLIRLDCVWYMAQSQAEAIKANKHLRYAIQDAIKQVHTLQDCGTSTESELRKLATGYSKAAKMLQSVNGDAYIIECYVAASTLYGKLLKAATA